MNETLTNILNRRSIRKFEATQIKDEELQAIIDAGNYAPSAMNQQSWHFVAIQNKEVLNKINEVTKAALANSGNPNFEARAKAENFSAFYNAPTFILVFGDEKAIAPTHDGSLALGNMLLAAKAVGVGSCWIHAMNFVLSTEEGKALKATLGVPEGYTPIGAGAFGYNSGETPAAPPRKAGTVTILK